MTGRTRAVLFVVAGCLATAAAASAQEPAASFDALAGRIQVGQRIWVTKTSLDGCARTRIGVAFARRCPEGSGSGNRYS